MSKYLPLQSFFVALLFLIGVGCQEKQPTPTITPAPTVNTSAQYVEERARLAAAIELNPDDPKVYLNLAQFELRNGKVAEVEKFLMGLRKKFPKSDTIAYELGKLYLSSGEFQAALQELEAATKLSSNPEYVVMLGFANFRLERYAEAERLAKIALKRDSKVAIAYLLLARVYGTKGKPEQSLEAVQNYLKYAENQEPGYYLMGRYYFRSNNAPEAEKWLKKALELNPNNYESWSLLGDVYTNLQAGTRSEEAVQCYQKAIELNPNDWESRTALGRHWIQKREASKAIEQFEAAMRVAPDPGPILYNLGQAYIQAGRTVDGHQRLKEYEAYRQYTTRVTKFKQDIAANPKNRALRYEYARFCLQFEQNQAAESVLLETKKLFGDDKTLRELLTKAQKE